VRLLTRDDTLLGHYPVVIGMLAGNALSCGVLQRRTPGQARLIAKHSSRTVLEDIQLWFSTSGNSSVSMMTLCRWPPSQALHTGTHVLCALTVLRDHAKVSCTSTCCVCPNDGDPVHRAAVGKSGSMTDLINHGYLSNHGRVTAIEDRRACQSFINDHSLMFARARCSSAMRCVVGDVNTFTV
jgi:hypothetical protein